MPSRRGSSSNPPNRFQQLHAEPLEIDVIYDEERPPVPTVFYRDSSRTILAGNDSPDLPFSYSINPYRGCEHGCIYCYARPSHEYLGFSAGLDFESRIMVKMDAPRLLEDALSAERWVPQVVAFSGNTDCYQPVERTLQLTRKCLAVFLEHRNPVGIITKNGLVARDIDLLQELARFNAVRVLISLITLDPALTRSMEPRASMPAVRLKAIEQLSRAGIPVGVNVAPVIPGLTDEEIPAILTAAVEHGATSAAWSPVRLPGAVAPLFTEWIQRTSPDRAGKVLSRIRETHGGELDDARFGYRMRGEGKFAEVIDDLFHLQVRRLGLDRERKELSTGHFQRLRDGQEELF